MIDPLNIFHTLINFKGFVLIVDGGGIPAPYGNYFVDGKLLNGTDHIWVHCIIRAGRKAAVKGRMLVEFIKVVTKISEVAEQNAPVHISKISARQVFEFEKILPNPSKEQ